MGHASAVVVSCLVLLLSGGAASRGLAQDHACSLPAEPDRALARADGVFLAQVVAVRDTIDSAYTVARTGQPTRLRLAALRPLLWWKQRAPADSILTVLAARPGLAPCLVSFRVGETYLVYATWAHGRWGTDRTDGTRRAAEAAIALRALGAPRDRATLRTAPGTPN